jgi:hypothetical protein
VTYVAQRLTRPGPEVALWVGAPPCALAGKFPRKIVHDLLPLLLPNSLVRGRRDGTATWLHRGVVRHIAVEIALPGKTKPRRGSGVLLCRDAIGRGIGGLMPESVPRPISHAQMSKGSV